MRARNSMLLVALAVAIGAALPVPAAQAETIVRYGISMADIPLTTGQPDRGVCISTSALRFHWRAHRHQRLDQLRNLR